MLRLTPPVWGTWRKLLKLCERVPWAGGPWAIFAHRSTPGVRETRVRDGMPAMWMPWEVLRTPGNPGYQEFWPKDWLARCLFHGLAPPRGLIRWEWAPLVLTEGPVEFSPNESNLHFGNIVLWRVVL